jgi:hypothetical protein
LAGTVITATSVSGTENTEAECGYASMFACQYTKYVTFLMIRKGDFTVTF